MQVLPQPAPAGATERRERILKDLIRQGHHYWPSAPEQARTLAVRRIVANTPTGSALRAELLAGLRRETRR